MPVRTATAADLEDVLALLTAHDLSVLGEVEVQRRYLEHNLAQAKDCVVAVGDQGLTGYGILDGTYDIRLTAVDAATADELLADVERRARRRGFDRLTCIALPEDTVLWQLLGRNGYAREREIVRMWRLSTANSLRRRGPTASASVPTPTQTANACTRCSIRPTQAGIRIMRRSITTTGSLS